MSPSGPAAPRRRSTRLGVLVALVIAAALAAGAVLVSNSDAPAPASSPQPASSSVTRFEVDPCRSAMRGPC